MVNKKSKTDICFGLYRGRITGHDISGAHKEASNPCFMILASDFSRDTLENTTHSFNALAHENNT